MNLLDCGRNPECFRGTPLSESVMAFQSGSQSFDGAGCHSSPHGAASWVAKTSKRLEGCWGLEPGIRPRKGWIEHENEDEGRGRLGAG